MGSFEVRDAASDEMLSGHNTRDRFVFDPHPYHRALDRKVLMTTF